MEAADNQGVNGSEKTSSTKKGKWVVATAGGSRFIGRLDAVGGVQFRAGSEVGMRAIVEAACISLRPAYDFFAPLQQLPNGAGFQRSPVVVATDFTLDPVPVHIKPTALVFLDDMTAEDRHIYEVLISDAEEQVAASRLQRRAATAGVQLPKKSGLIL